jgi:type II secretory ATPase GspE/PulE/Tfp pilus assembly ATPase PilB-like protein
MAQRLVRELCPKCKKKVLAKKEERDIIEKAINSISSKINLDLKIPENLYEAVGCPHCNGTGFKGRIPILEILLIGKEMEKFLVNNPTESEIEEKAVEDGMLTMFQDGVVRVLLGQTTLEEILREAD